MNNNNISIEAVIPCTEEYQKYVDVYRAYINAGLTVPDDIMERFDFNMPPKDGMPIYLENNCSIGPNGEVIYTIDLSSIPPTSKYLRIILTDLQKG